GIHGRLRAGLERIGERHAPDEQQPSSHGGLMSIGISIRGTAGYVVDPAGSTYITELETYPTTRAGYTFGVDSGQYLDNSADRDSGVDPRLAGGGHRNNGGSIGLLRVDLPDGPGTRAIGLALGDALATVGPFCVEIWDDMTPVAL